MDVSTATIDIDKILSPWKPSDYQVICQRNTQNSIISYNEIKFSFKTQSTQHLPDLNNICSLLGKNFS